MPVIYVDVDDTLIRTFGAKRMGVSPTIAKVRELAAAGCELYCWSAGGADYARSIAQQYEIDSCFRAFLPKPHALIDDSPIARWNLLELHPHEAASLSALELVARLAS